MSELRLGIKLTADGAGNVTAELTKVDGALNKLDQSAKSTSQSLAAGHKGLEQYAIGLGKLTIGFMSVQQAAAGFKSVIDATAQMDRLRGMMEASTGSATAAAQGMQFVQQTSKALGISLVAATDGFAQLTAAARGTSLQGQATNDIFLSVSKASAALGKSAEDTSSMITALSQMISKGTVSMEELRGQLGDRLPGAFQLAARAMGVTTQELDKMVSSGQVMADQLLPKLAKALDETYSNARFDRLNNNIARLDNAWTQLKGNIMDSDGMSKAIGLLAESLEGWGSTVKTPSLEERINEQIQAITQLENSTKRYQYLYRDAVEKEIASRKQMLELLIAQQKIENIRAKDAEIAPAKSALDLGGLDEQKKRVAQIVIDTAKAYKVDPAFALAIAEQESGFNQLAVSAKKAQGVMQLLPGTAKQLGVDFTNLNDNIKGGVLYLAQQEKQFKSLRLASAAYNAGPSNVQKYGGVPPFKETQNYVQSVGALYEKWQKVLGVQGEAFISAKDQADETANSYKRIQTHQDDAIKRAEDYARVQVETIKTQLASMDQEREASARLTAEQLAGAKTYADKAAIIADAQQKADDYNARALDMVRAEFDAQQKAIEARKQAYETELAQADKYNVSIDEQFKLKQAIRSADTDLMLLAQNRAQAEINAAGKVNDFAKQSADLKRNEASAIDGIIQAYQRQVDILDRLTAAKQAGANADQLALLNDVYQSTGNLPELVSQDQLARMQQYILSTQALKGAVDELTGSQKKNQEQAVKEAQLRMNAYWDQTIQRLQKYAALMEKITGEKNPWVDLSVGIMEYAKSVDQIGQKYDDLQKEWRKSTGAADDQADSYLKVQEALEQGQAAAGMMAETMLAIRDNTEKGSKAYNDLSIAAENFIAVQQLLNIADGIAAILKQLKDGDPYTAAVRAAAVAIQVASMGINTGFSGSGGGLSGKDNINRDGTDGGVFGGKADEVSNSIADSLEIIKQNSSSDLNYSAAMLRALQNIESALAGVSNQVIRGVGPSQIAMTSIGSQNLSQKINPMAGFADPLTNAIHSFVMNFSTKLVGYGIQGLDQSLNDILKNGLQGLTFTDIEKTTKVFGMTVSKKLETVYEELASPVERQLTLVFKGIADALKAGAEAFGLTGEQVMQRIGNTSLNIGKLDLAGLSGEEVQQKLSEAFSAMTDTLAKKLMPGLKDFMQVGEGYSKTFFRVADGVNRATGAMERLGVETVRYTTLANKQGDVATEIVYESLVAQNKLTANLKQFLKDLKTTADSAEDFVASYEQMMKASTLMKAGGLNAAGLSQDMTNAAGGLDAFVAAMETFNSDILSRDMSATIMDLSTRFNELGYALPSSREAFADIVRSINVTDEAGQKLFGQMIALSGAMSQVFNETERLTQKYASLLDPMYDIRKRIEEVGSDFNTLITEKLAPIESKYAKQRDSRQADINMLQPGYNDAMEIVNTIPAQIDAWLEEMKTAKPARKKKLQQMISDARVELHDAQQVIDTYGAWIKEAQKAISDIDASEINDKAAAQAPLLNQARDAMAMTLEEIFNSIVQAVQQAQQRLQSVLDLQKSLASQLAQLQGPGAVFNLARNSRNEAFGAIDQYIAGVQGGGARDVATEVSLLQTAQQAVMDKYNAEIAAIQEAEQAFIAAETERLNAALQLQIDAINARTEAAIKAENDRLNAAVKVRQKIDEAAIKSQQKAFDAANKAQQKAFDEEQKALQKIHDEKLQALQDEMDAATKLRDAIVSIADYAAGMRLGQNSTLSPEARLAEAQRQYQELQAKASGGDAEAMAKLTGASDAYLEAAKTYYGSSTNYQDIFDGVQRAMESIGGMSAPDPDSIQSRIDQLREAQAAEMEALRELQAEKLDAIREGQQDQLDAIREQQQGSIDAMREASQAQQDAIRKAAQSQIESLQKATQQAIADLSDPAKNRAMAEAKAAAERDMKELQRLAELSRIEAQRQADLARDEAAKQAEAAWKLANDQLKALGDANGLGEATLKALNEILKKNAITPIPIPVQARAKGGYTPAVLTLVGEQGPEIVNFSKPGMVYTAAQSQSLLGNDEKVVKAIEALKAEMRAVAVTQSNANPEIIAELREMKDRLNQIERTNKLAATSK